MPLAALRFGTRVFALHAPECGGPVAFASLLCRSERVVPNGKHADGHGGGRDGYGHGHGGGGHGGIGRGGKGDRRRANAPYSAVIESLKAAQRDVHDMVLSPAKQRSDGNQPPTTGGGCGGGAGAGAGGGTGGCGTPDERGAAPAEALNIRPSRASQRRGSQNVSFRDDTPRSDAPGPSPRHEEVAVNADI